MKFKRDLKAELVESQLAAQQWEDKYIGAMRQLEESRAFCSQLRVELGQASRELMACSAELEQCRKERSAMEDSILEEYGVVDPGQIVGVTEMHTTGPKYESAQDEALSQYANQPHDFEVLEHEEEAPEPDWERLQEDLDSPLEEEAL